MSKERLVELIGNAPIGVNGITLLDKHKRKVIEEVADYLIANGVIVPHFKIGDKVYFSDILDRNEPSCIDRIETLIEKRNTTIVKETYYYSNTGDIFANRHIGEIAFHTKEEAEQKQRKEDEGK